MNHKFFAFTLLSVAVLSGCSTLTQNSSTLNIAKQGSFAVGGSIKVSEGTYTSIPNEIANETMYKSFICQKLALKAIPISLLVI